MGAAIQALIDAGMRMELRGDRLHVSSPRALTEQERTFIQANKSELMASLCLEKITEVSETVPGRPLAPENTWRFLFGCPFTRRMLEVAAAKWSAPLNEQDINNIAHGYYRYEQREQTLKDYLRQWAENHPEQMAILNERIGRDRHGMWAARAPLDYYGRLVEFPGDPRTGADHARAQHHRS